MYQILITYPCLSFMQMDLQNTSMTVQLGRGARIQLANAVIQTGKTGATIQFGSVDFPAIVARASGAPTRRAHLPCHNLLLKFLVGGFLYSRGYHSLKSQLPRGLCLMEESLW
ncbi:hypothetical protein MA16_Dca028107 [Dendrobium catenatum]|uniref:Uncharacterized protein n=1 Tax=Dendrobium catenatum TaxID=906689 RepID=A0A2I0VAQ9_9ASPA|nr:hypothetical protein MA16_Dca028107 [Dendrobium catenatum]